MTYIATYYSGNTGQQYMSIKDFEVIGAIDGLDLMKIKRSI